MIATQNVLGIVLARSGSKGLPGKNIKLLCGKPLVAWSIEAGLFSKYIDDLVVSTDGAEIASLSKKLGAEVPFIRPSNLATDEASSVDAIIHALDYLENKGRYYDIVALLEPTSPLREASDIDAALELLINQNATAVVSVCKSEAQHPSFIFRMNNDSKKISPFLGRQPNALRRQDISSTYFLDGTIYCSTTDALKENRGFYHDDTRAVVMPKWKSLEIDDLDDFLMVEAIMRSRFSFQ